MLENKLFWIQTAVFVVESCLISLFYQQLRNKLLELIQIILVGTYVCMEAHLFLEVLVISR